MLNRTYRVQNVGLVTSMLALSAPLAQAHVSRAAPRTGSPANPIRIAAGDQLTATFLTGASSGTMPRAPRVFLPVGWTAVADPALLAPGPRTSAAWQSRVATPVGAPAGRYVLRAVTEGGTDSLVVEIAAEHSIEMIALQPPSWTFPGGRYRGRLIVRNAGNAEATIAFQVEQREGEARSATPAQVTLAPGMCRTVTITGVAPAAAGPDTVRVTAYDRDAESVRATVFVRVTVVPRQG